jgi:hypothetical protein
MATVDGGITLDIAQAQLTAAIAALAAAREQQNFAVTSPTGGRSGSRAMLTQLLDDVKFWRQEVARLQRGNSGPTISLGVSCG